jgi:hypothetical protein
MRSARGDRIGNRASIDREQRVAGANACLLRLRLATHRSHGVTPGIGLRPDIVRHQPPRVAVVGRQVCASIVEFVQHRFEHAKARPIGSRSCVFSPVVLHRGRPVSLLDIEIRIAVGSKLAKRSTSLAFCAAADKFRGATVNARVNVAIKNLTSASLQRVPRRFMATIRLPAHRKGHSESRLTIRLKDHGRMSSSHLGHGDFPS